MKRRKQEGTPELAWTELQAKDLMKKAKYRVKELEAKQFDLKQQLGVARGEVVQWQLYLERHFNS